MTPEEKARAYDEAIKKAAALYKASEPMSGCNVIIETLFPELKESEGESGDEKIRKALIDFFGKSAKYGGQTNGVYDKDILAWLERQGEQIDTANKEYWRGYREGKKLILDKYAETEKQNGQDILEDAILDGNEDGLIAETIRYKHEKQSEQKSDKVEPKFKVGDWIINPKTGNVLQIKNVLLCGNKGNYEFDYSSMPIESVDKHYHLWTLEDAKDGDVLAFKNNICGIIICKSPNDYDTRSYCRFVSDNFINKEESGWDSTLLVPATKEQRDLLFQKMREAGYEWDAEKKELKKIGQKPLKVYRVENEAEEKGLWRKFDGTWQPLFDMLTDGKCKDMPMEDNPIYREGGKRWFASAPSKEALREWFSKRDLEELVSKGFTITEFEVTEYKKVSDFEYIFTRDNIINKCYLEVSDIYPEHKPAWSEENDDDDAWMNDIISKVENNLQLNKAEIDWLKSLKERIN